MKKLRFYIGTSLGRKILRDFWRLDKWPRPTKAAWQFAHVINIPDAEHEQYPFLDFIKYPLYSNQFGDVWGTQY